MHLKEAYSAPQICRRFLVQAESKNDGAVSNDCLMFLSLNLYFPLVPSSATYAAKEGSSTLHDAYVYAGTHGCSFSLRCFTYFMEKIPSSGAHKSFSGKSPFHIYTTQNLFFFRKDPLMGPIDMKFIILSPISNVTTGFYE